MKVRLLNFISTLIVLLVIYSCARIVKPTGGEEDLLPPIIITADPDHESIHFDSDQFQLSFNEYVKLLNANRQLVISPPMEYPPEITPMGTASKVITLKILDTLKENTTYTFNFGNSIEDNNEGNVLENFKYVFSTGDYIDSLIIKGRVDDAFDYLLEKNVSIQLYELTENFTDSVIYNERPSYVGRTTDSINFEITNLKSGKYLMIALEDFSNNYMFDPKQDKIDFYPDTITLPSDEDINIQLSLFKEVPEYEIRRPSEVKKGHIYFGYQGDAKDINIDLISDKPENFKSTLIFEKEKDTVSYWYTPIAADSLIFKITNQNSIDTLTVRLRSKEIDSLIVKGSASSLSLRDTFAISTNIPISTINRNKISLINGDSLNINFTTTISSNQMNFKLNFEKGFDEKYSLELLPNAIEDLFGSTNDTLKINFSTKNPDNYGSIGLTLQNAESYPLILDLLDESFELIERVYMTEQQSFKFEYLDSKNYLFRVIYDTNENRKWDTGNFLLRKKPEKVIYSGQIIEIRPFWDLDEIFNLK